MNVLDNPHISKLPVLIKIIKILFNNFLNSHSVISANSKDIFKEDVKLNFVFDDLGLHKINNQIM